MKVDYIVRYAALASVVRIFETALSFFAFVIENVETSDAGARHRTARDVEVARG